MNWRRYRVPGLLAVCLGVGLAVAGASPAPTAIGYLFGLAVVGCGLAFLFGSFSLLGYRPDAGDRWHPSAPEPGYRVPTPGDELAALEPAERRERLRRVAVASLVEARGCSRADARRRLAAGTWTDDSIAASYLGDDDVQSPLGARLRAALAGRSAEDRAIERTVAALDDLRTGSTHP